MINPPKNYDKEEFFEEEIKYLKDLDTDSLEKKIECFSDNKKLATIAYNLSIAIYNSVGLIKGVNGSSNVKKALEEDSMKEELRSVYEIIEKHKDKYKLTSPTNNPEINKFKEGLKEILKILKNNIDKIDEFLITYKTSPRRTQDVYKELTGYAEEILKDEIKKVNDLNGEITRKTSLRFKLENRKKNTSKIDNEIKELINNKEELNKDITDKKKGLALHLGFYHTINYYLNKIINHEELTPDMIYETVFPVINGTDKRFYSSEGLSEVLRLTNNYEFINDSLINHMSNEAVMSVTTKEYEALLTAKKERVLTEEELRKIIYHEGRKEITNELVINNYGSVKSSIPESSNPYLKALKRLQEYDDEVKGKV